ncbi:MAG: nucleotide sugar dehydrogenase [Gammaproteobacteria bacterium]|nr:nucleotide sugar dehydrogenase [Gammaproteobacteria bacterium]
MKVTIFGTGYVGLVTGTCLAEVGNDVLCVDVDKKKIDLLNNGGIPIYEPGLEELVAKNRKHGKLKFTTDIEKGVKHGLFQFIAVGTPPDEDGSADLQYVLKVAETVGQHMDEYRIVIDKSTVPVGTADRVTEKVQGKLDERGVKLDFDVVSNPEFLKEGAAIDDFMKPDRIIVGTNNVRTAELLKALYAPFNRNHDRLIIMDIRSAELAKYAANAMLATKISFMNELSNIAELTGADIEQVRLGIGSDPRIGYHFIYPGAGYGGSCFPKDVRALERTAKSYGYNAQLLASVEAVNDSQKHVVVNKILKHYHGNVKDKTFAMWGLSFKPNTDDMREASSRVVMENLWAQGAKIRAYDPQAMHEATRIYGQRKDLELVESPEDAVDGVDALIVMTEWNVFRSPDFSVLKQKMKTPIIFDGRNIYNPQLLHEFGFIYHSIGRQVVGS